MTNKTRRHIWPLAVMSLVAFGVFAVVVALSMGGPQTASAHDCDTIADPVDRATCLTVHEQQGEDHDAVVELPMPMNAMVEAEANRQLTVSWDMVEGAGGYRVEYKRASDSAYTLAATLGPDATSHVQPGLIPATTYNFRITALGVEDESLDSPAAITSGMTLPVSYDLLLKHGDASIGQTIVCPDRMDPRVECESGENAHTRAEADGTTTTVVEFEEVDAQLGNADDRIDQANIRVSDEEVRIHAEVNTDSPSDTTTVSIRIENSDGTTNFDANPGITYKTAGLNAPGVRSIEDGTLDIQIRDAATRVFDVYVTCTGEDITGTLDIEVRDDDQNLVAQAEIVCAPPFVEVPGPSEERGGKYSVASYGDWEFDDVTDGFLVLDANGPYQMVNHHHMEKGHINRDEPVVMEYQLGISDVELLTKRIEVPEQREPEWVPEGQGTIQVLFGTPNVQITVTATESGPAYIRFLTSDMQPFGTDVDEEGPRRGADLDDEYAHRGADVVGLDSQGRLTMARASLTAAEALAYDQFSVVVPHDSIPGDQGPSDAHDADDSELQGISSESLLADEDTGDYYYQGSFRFFDPCPSEAGAGYHFYVEVYEKDGKYRRAVEKVMCEGPLRPGPTGLRFEVDSDVIGQGIASYNRAINSDSHTVLLVNAVDRTIVAQRPNAGTAEVFTGLNNGWEYHLIVIAENRNGTYNADAITARVRWLGQSPAPQSPIGAPPAPTGRNILCQTGQKQVMALLADCDLGMVTGLSAEAGADPGTVNLTWTAGANSTMHWLAGIKVSDWQADNFANNIFQKTTGEQTHTVVGLSSGEQYAFTVVSGRAFDTGEPEWHDSWAEIQYVTPE